MPARIKDGYLRVTFLGFDRKLPVWRGQRIRDLAPEQQEKLVWTFNEMILSGNYDAVKMWFPKERAKLLIKKICWDWLYHKPKRPATIDQQKDTLEKYLIPHNGKQSVKELTLQDFDWIRKEHGDTYMAKQIRSTVQAVLNYTWRKGLMDKQLYIWPISTAKKPTPYIELADRWQIHSIADPFYQDAILLSIECGMRVGEIVALQWGAILFEHERIKLVRALSGRDIVDMRKGGDEVWIPMRGTTKEMLLRRRKNIDSLWVFPAYHGGHTWRNRITMAFKVAAKKIGLPHARLHHNRNCVAIDMGLAGASLEEIQEQLGHRVRQTTEKYKGQIGFRRMGKVRWMNGK